MGPPPGQLANEALGQIAHRRSCSLYLRSHPVNRLGFNVAVAVVIGFIALAGVAAETDVVKLIYLDAATTEIDPVDLHFEKAL
jgi:Zn-dependent protease